MGSSQVEENLIETSEEQDLDGRDATKLVPVTEAIRHRKRAQSAEKRAETLTEELSEANRKIAQLSQDLNELEVEQTLARKLVAAGVADLEAAVLIAKARMEGQAEADIDGCVEQLRKEKAHLFNAPAEASAFRKTAGVKDRVKQTQAALEQAAKKAARTGSRADLQQYLRLRRNLL
jgi:hypothetical protein